MNLDHRNSPDEGISARTLFGIFLPAALLFFSSAPGCGNSGDTRGSFARWEKIEITFTGPDSRVLGEPNPFALEFYVLFTAPDGRGFRVPGFYDGDGNGNGDGDVWKVRFSADQNGDWRYATESPDSTLNAVTGTFNVTGPAAEAPEFYRWGRLEYVGKRYLKFREGPYWIKFGADEPESFLGDAFGRDDWEAKKRELDYLAERRINSIYVMTHTLDGDGNDVWPWVGSTSEEAKQNSDRYDVQKLAQWLDFFEHAQRKGIVIHLVFEDDSAWTGYDHRRYYREMVARFGHLPALYFNLGEEYNENYPFAQALEYMRMVEEIDPYDHPRAIHNVRFPRTEYIDAPVLQLSSIQTDPTGPKRLNQWAIDWLEACLVRNRRPLVISFDEARPPGDRRSWWSVYLGGGQYEAIVPVPDGFAAAEPVWKELAAARKFMESLPFEKMFPANHLVRAGAAFCLADPGNEYAFYLPEGGEVQVELAGDEKTFYDVIWFDPRQSEFFDKIVTVNGGGAELKAPDAQDWAVRLRRTQGDAPATPMAASAFVRSTENRPASIHLAVMGSEDAENYECKVTHPPRHGSLINTGTGTGCDRIYTPQKGYSGDDSFSWQAKGKDWVSNTAIVRLHAGASGENAVPIVRDQEFRIPAGSPFFFILRFSDPDGPGPYEIHDARRPAHGKLEGVENDLTYTPEPGFRGTDRFVWQVRDGVGISKQATVTFTVY